MERVPPVRIFVCYAHEDEALLNKLKAHLRILQRIGLIVVWHDRDISAGANWEREIDQQLMSADIVLLLISSDFMNSDYCYCVEMEKALRWQKIGKIGVIPVILRPVAWQEAPFSSLQALPTDAKPITRWSDQDEAFLDVAKGICTAARELEKIPLEVYQNAVWWFNEAKGFGFIRQGNGEPDVFVHHTAIQSEGFRALKKGQKVKFDLTKGPKGLQATNVRPDDDL